MLFHKTMPCESLAKLLGTHPVTESHISDLLNRNKLHCSIIGLALQYNLNVIIMYNSNYLSICKLSHASQGKNVTPTHCSLLLCLLPVSI